MEAYIGIGANMDRARESVRTAISRLDKKETIKVRQVSGLFRTAAWGDTDQPDFVNAVALVETDLNPAELLLILQQVEDEMGRQRDGRRWGPRNIDLDLLLCGVQVISLPDLQVPHPQMHRRAFVLVPLLEIDPAVEIPGLGPAKNFLEAVCDQSIVPLK